MSDFPTKVKNGIYWEVAFNNEKRKTDICKDSSLPSWNQTFEFISLPDTIFSDKEIKLSCYVNSILGDTCTSHASVDITSLNIGFYKQDSLRVEASGTKQDRDANPRGHLHVALKNPNLLPKSCFPRSGIVLNGSLKLRRKKRLVLCWATLDCSQLRVYKYEKDPEIDAILVIKLSEVTHFVLNLQPSLAFGLTCCANSGKLVIFQAENDYDKALWCTAIDALMNRGLQSSIQPIWRHNLMRKTSFETFKGGTIKSNHEEEWSYYQEG